MVKAAGYPESISRFFAHEGADPLSRAFSKKLVIHPGIHGQRVDPATYDRKWSELRSIKRSGEGTVYIHIPFCKNHCLFCGFYINAVGRDSSQTYTDLLIEELRQESETAAVTSESIQAVYLGGGTPTALRSQDLERLLDAIHRYLPLSNDCEITVEGRIKDLELEKIQSCLKAGATRFSFGVQSFDTETRKSMGRFASREEVESKLAGILALGRAVVAIDLIYGLPTQDIAVWENDLERCAELGVDGVSVYLLNVHPKGPLATAIGNGKIPPIRPLHELSSYFALANDVLKASGYRQVSLTHWGRSTRERSLYNQYSKKGVPCLAYGSGAGGALSNYMYHQNRELDVYTKDVTSGRKSIAAMVELPALHALYSSISGAIENAGMLPLSLISNALDDRTCEFLMPLLRQWEQCGLVELSNSSMELTRAGQFWHMNICQGLLECLDWASRHELNVRSELEVERQGAARV